MGPTHRRMTVFGIAVVSVAMVTAAMVPAASAGVQASPVFQPASFSSGITQYGDAIQRAEFWGPVSTNGGGYHMLLGQPTVLPTQTITVHTAFDALLRTAARTTRGPASPKRSRP